MNRVLVIQVALIACCSCHWDRDSRVEKPVHEMRTPPAGEQGRDQMDVAISRDEAIKIATEEAISRGYSPEGLDTGAQIVDELWEVSFSRVTPGVLGGEGFMVRLNAATGVFVDLRRFQ